MNIKDVIKRTANLAGVDISRFGNKPRATLLGLKHLPIRTVLDIGANTGQFARYAGGTV